MNNKNIFAERLKSRRKSANITQSELGDILGMRKSAVSMMEKGNSSPTFETITALANHFNVPTDYFTGAGLFAQYDEIIAHRAAIEAIIAREIAVEPDVLPGPFPLTLTEILRIASDIRFVTLLSALVTEIDFSDGIKIRYTFE